MRNLVQIFFMSVLLVGTTSVLHAQALYVQINLQRESVEEMRNDEDEDAADERGEPSFDESCSILEVAEDGTLTEIVSNADILAVTGETVADCGDTGLAVAPDGTIYFSEDESHHILRRTTDGTLSIFVDAADIDTLIGETSDNDNGMDVGPGGTLFVADEDCDCIYTVSPDGNTLEIIVTESDIGTVTGNLSDFGPGRGSCSGDPAADLEGGLVVSSSGVVYFADDGSGCHPDRPQAGFLVRGGFFAPFDSLDSILRAVPDGVGGYTVSIVADEDDIFAAVPSLYPAGFGTCGEDFADLDVDIDLGTDGMLYVLEDGATQLAPSECAERGPLPFNAIESEDKVLRMDPTTGAVSLVASGDAFGALSGPNGEDQADFEGGISYAGGVLYVGDRVQAEDQSQLRGPGPMTLNNIFRVTTSGGVSIHVSRAQLEALYGPLYPDFTPRLSGGMDSIDNVSVLEIPVAGGAGLAALIALLALIGIWTVRRLV